MVSVGKVVMMIENGVILKYCWLHIKDVEKSLKFGKSEIKILNFLQMNPQC